MYSTWKDAIPLHGAGWAQCCVPSAAPQTMHAELFDSLCVGSLACSASEGTQWMEKASLYILAVTGQTSSTCTVEHGAAIAQLSLEVSPLRDISDCTYLHMQHPMAWQGRHRVMRLQGSLVQPQFVPGSHCCSASTLCHGEFDLRQLLK